MYYVAAKTDRGFCRAGIRFPKEGAILDPADVSDEQLELILRDPNLYARPATEAELGHDPEGDARALVDMDRAAIVQEAIEALGPEGFSAGGDPKVSAINAAMPGDAEPVDSKERDRYWGAMVASGATAPKPGPKPGGVAMS